MHAPEVAPRVLVVGGGKLGQAAAQLLSQQGAQVDVWVRGKATTKKAHAQLHALTLDADMIFLAVPAPALMDVLPTLGGAARGSHVVLHACRGMVPTTDGMAVWPHQALRQHTCWQQVGVLGGPLTTEEHGPQHRLVAVLATRFDRVHQMLMQVAGAGRLTLQRTRDVIGLEVLGACGNIAHLAVGAARALDFGDTTSSLLHMHVLADAGRLGVALGAQPQSFAGVGVIGELVPRRITNLRLHTEAGAALARGKSVPGLTHLEGVVSTGALVLEAKRLGVAVPGIQAVDRMLWHAQTGRDGSVRSMLEEVLRLDVDMRHMAARA
jgi:glycerol-3-phosphate dehydrogenase (NAD(P)+)